MIFFDKIFLKNFLSVGNSGITIRLSDTKLTLFMGANGSGKSIVLDALSYGLYGKPHRNIKLEQLINSVNERELLVEIDLKSKGNTYKICRGINPKVFRIYENGELRHQDAHNKDYQSFIENDILNMNYRTFTQIVILGKAMFIPFMKLVSQARREFIEHLLDIQLFSVMNILLKQKNIDNRDAIIQIESDINVCQKKIELHKRHTDILNQNHQELIEQKNNKINEYRLELLELEYSYYNTTVIINELKDNIRNKNQLEKTLREYTSAQEKLKNKQDKIKNDIKFFNESNVCPTCKQDISDDFKTNIVFQKTSNHDVIEIHLANLKDDIVPIIKKLEYIDNCEEAICHCNDLIEELNHTIGLLKGFVNELKNDIIILNNQSKTQSDITAEDALSFKSELIECQAKKEELINNRHIYEIINNLLSDGGIKKQIIKQYIPIINDLINKYLKELDFNCLFKFDEEFNETILSRYRDKFSYDSFSEGQKIRIDLALLWTWREISKMRNSTSTNLLMLDEIFVNSSLDQDGMDEFINMLYKLVGETNVFIMCPNGDNFDNKFESVFKFSLIKLFTKMERMEKKV